MKRKKICLVLLAGVLVVALFVGIRYTVQRAYRHQHLMDVWWGAKNYRELSKQMKDTPVVLLAKDEYGFEDDVYYGTLMDGPEDNRHAIGYTASGSFSLEDGKTFRLDVDCGPIDHFGAAEGHVLSAYRGTDIHTRRLYLPYVDDGKTRRQVIAAIELDGIVYRATVTYDAPGSTPEALQAQEDVLEQKNAQLLQKIVDQYMDQP